MMRRTSAAPASRRSGLLVMNDELAVLAQVLRAGRFAHAAAFLVGLRHEKNQYVEGADVAAAGNGELPACARRERPVAECIAVEVVRSEEHTYELQSLIRISYAVFSFKYKNTIL